MCESHDESRFRTEMRYAPQVMPHRAVQYNFAIFISGLTLSLLCIVTSKNSKNLMESVQPTDSPVKVTAVFIDCEIDDMQKVSKEEDNRFEREELFKHNALRNCDKKLALTIKLTSKSANSADEYVPIDHVVDGRSKRRVRLLNPYVLHLRRDAPLEAYRLKFIEVNTSLYYSLYLLYTLGINTTNKNQRA
ncbi:uncharacterized protein LOC133520752 [Cydia pomonella]|uniref:uncharacterized protein LOC133520752 n=1 Tax=Cydia pomonella TaxID=82600 RepID=UPI002ADE2A2A|nr:uncharacterized protein LOC133520752 [Cydia pomonella]